ncbi:MAG TPA: glutathione S-transferase family protein [Afifellaceae bacterium]|nr:glutathione S-transferase family protein [Afifellaceae bacterium]
MPPTDTADLVLFYAPRSRALTVLWLLEELGQPFRIESVDIRAGEQKRPEFLTINPMGKVPAVRDGEIAVAESGAIIAWLADRYSSGDLAPRADEPARADYLRWLFFAAGVMEPAFGQKFFKLDLPAQQVGWGSFEQMEAVVTQAVAGREWLAGDRFTAADLYVSANLHFGVSFGILPGEGPIANYVARITARPAFKRATAFEADRVAERERAEAES